MRWYSAGIEKTIGGRLRRKRWGLEGGNLRQSWREGGNGNRRRVWGCGKLKREEERMQAVLFLDGVEEGFCSGYRGR